MPLEERQEKQLVDWCMTHGVHATCPFCGQNDWSPGEILVPPSPENESSPDRLEAGAMVQIICDHCKLAMLFDAGSVLASSPT